MYLFMYLYLYLIIYKNIFIIYYFKVLETNCPQLSVVPNITTPVNRAYGLHGRFGKKGEIKKFIDEILRILIFF